MTRVLSIDLDYITRPYAEWTNHLFEMNSTRDGPNLWRNLHLIEVISLLTLQI